MVVIATSGTGEEECVHVWRRWWWRFEHLADVLFQQRQFSSTLPLGFRMLSTQQVLQRERERELINCKRHQQQAATFFRDTERKNRYRMRK